MLAPLGEHLKRQCDEVAKRWDDFQTEMERLDEDGGDADMRSTFLAYWEKREREARFLGPLGALPLSAVGEAGERIFGEDGAVITAALTGFERLCERLWERACVGVVPPLPPVECKLQFLGVEVPDAVNLPCALSKVEGLFPLGPSLGGSGLARCILLCV
jgi:hypothetical protein